MSNLSKFEKFTGVYCSGFFIPDPAMLTTLCMLFENFYLVNNLEYLLEFVKKYRFSMDSDPLLLEQANKIIIKPHEDYSEDAYVDPFQGLNELQQKTAKIYMLHVRNFIMRHHELIGNVIKTSMLPDDQVLEAKLIRKGEPGKLNTYAVSPKPLLVTLDGLKQFDDLINTGAIPVIGKYHMKTYYTTRKNIPSKYLASLLAMKSIEMILPAMKEANPETILEARDKLHDQLPLFWSSMLKLSVELKTRIEDNMNMKDIIAETQDIIDTTVCPAIIELKRKLELERKNWFYRILHPLFDGVKMFIGNPQLTTANLALTGLATGLNIANNFVCQAEEVDKVKNEAGLIFLLRLDEQLSKKNL